MTSHERLRTGLLISGLFDEIPLAKVESLITRGRARENRGRATELGARNNSVPGAGSMVVRGVAEAHGRRQASREAVAGSTSRLNRSATGGCRSRGPWSLP
jgi:hypothetical protein